MTRICVAVTNDLTYDQRMLRICRTLAAAGYQVRFVGRVLPDSVSLGEEPFRQVRLKCWFLKGPWFYAEFNIRLLCYLLVNAFDIAVACDLDTALAIRWAARLRGKPSVYDAHELFTEVPELAGRPFARRIWSLIGRWTVRKHTLRYTVGPRIAEALSERYDAPFEVIRNVPILRPGPVPSMPERQPVILYTGALNAGRGLEAAIDAMAHIQGYTLHLAGEGDLSSALRDRVAKRDLTDRVQFLGKLPPERLSEHAREATLGLNLLESRSLSYYYSLANKFFDYMHAGLPSVNMDFPEYRDLIDSTGVGVCIADLNVEMIVQTLGTLLNDQGRLEQMQARCLAARKVFHWNHEAARLTEMYRRIRIPEPGS